MTGTGKRVVELTGQGECVEKILVFLKPGLNDVQLISAAEEAGSYAGRLIVRRRRSLTALYVMIAAVLAFAAGAAAGIYLL